MFFSFDGIDGAGKSTQIDLFCDWLAARGLAVWRCRDPGSTPLGDRVREILLHADKATPIGARAEMLLYMAARAQLVDQVIRPALAAGEVVVSDRYLLANIVYQGHAGGLRPEDVRRVGGVTVDGVAPDCTFLLDIDPAAADARLDGPRDRMERRSAGYRKKVREGFLDEASRDPHCHVVNAGQPIEAVHAEVRRIAESYLGAELPPA